MSDYLEVEKKYKGKSRSFLLSVITCMEAEKEVLVEKVDNLSYRLETIKSSLVQP